MGLFDQRICHLTFSHTDCSDVWKLYFPQMREHFDSGMVHHVAVNRADEALPQYIAPVLYDEADPYPKRLLSCLKQLEQYEFIFFDHEDMFLYEQPDIQELQAYYDYITSGRLDHIRLIKGGEFKAETVSDCPSLHVLSPRSKWIFSIQPSFWRRTTLIDILQANLKVNIWELEVKSQKVVRKMKLKAAFSYRAGRRRGLHHFDNDVYPYVATAIGKGKWNLGEYGTELGPLLEKNEIDPSLRGWF